MQSPSRVLAVESLIEHGSHRFYVSCGFRSPKPPPFQSMISDQLERTCTPTLMQRKDSNHTN